MNRDFGIIVFDSRDRKYYHAPVMPGPAVDHRIEDPFAFARSAGRHEGRIPIATLARVQDRLAGNNGSVSFVVRGGCDERERPLLELEIAGSLCLQCDRCLGEFEFPLALRTRLLLAQPGVTLGGDEDPDAPEWIEARRDLDVQDLIEDEIVLSLPLSVRHAQGKCSDEAAGSRRTGAADSPFTRLADLLQTSRRKSQ